MNRAYICMWRAFPEFSGLISLQNVWEGSCWNIERYIKIGYVLLFMVLFINRCSSNWSTLHVCNEFPPILRCSTQQKLTLLRQRKRNTRGARQYHLPFSFVWPDIYTVVKYKFHFYFYLWLITVHLFDHLSAAIRSHVSPSVSDDTFPLLLCPADKAFRIWILMRNRNFESQKHGSDWCHGMWLDMMSFPPHIPDAPTNPTCSSQLTSIKFSTIFFFKKADKAKGKRETLNTLLWWYTASIEP